MFSWQTIVTSYYFTRWTTQTVRVCWWAAGVCARHPTLETLHQTQRSEPHPGFRLWQSRGQRGRWLEAPPGLSHYVLGEWHASLLPCGLPGSCLWFHPPVDNRPIKMLKSGCCVTTSCDVWWIRLLTGSTSPLNVISPVMATSDLTNRPLNSEARQVTMVTPAEGPSLVTAPAGKWRWMSVPSNGSGHPTTFQSQTVYMFTRLINIRYMYV